MLWHHILHNVICSPTLDMAILCLFSSSSLVMFDYLKPSKIPISFHLMYIDILDISNSLAISINDKAIAFKYYICSKLIVSILVLFTVDNLSPCSLKANIIYANFLSLFLYIEQYS